MYVWSVYTYVCMYVGMMYVWCVWSLWSVCMYVCMHACMYVCMYMHDLYVCMYVWCAWSVWSVWSVGSVCTYVCIHDLYVCMSDLYDLHVWCACLYELSYVWFVRMYVFMICMYVCMICSPHMCIRLAFMYAASIVYMYLFMYFLYIFLYVFMYVDSRIWMYMYCKITYIRVCSDACTTILVLQYCYKLFFYVFWQKFAVWLGDFWPCRFPLDFSFHGCPGLARFLTGLYACACVWYTCCLCCLTENSLSVDDMHERMSVHWLPVTHVLKVVASLRIHTLCFGVCTGFGDARAGGASQCTHLCLGTFCSSKVMNFQTQ
jgi:hypothetical protein